MIQFLLRRSSLFLIVCTALIFSCKKSGLIGTNILPGSDNLNGIYTDTVSVKTFTVLEDSLKTSTLSKYLAGSIDDPTFGKSTAGFFTQLRLPTNNINLGTPDTLFIDSTVLQLDYAGYYGDTTVSEKLTVYQITEDMNADSNYYSNRVFAFNPSALGSKTITQPHFYDSVTVLTQLVEPHLRINLSNTFGQEILNQSGTTNFTDNTAFLSYFKGLYVAADVSNGYGKCIYYFNLGNTISRVNFYYHTPNIASKSFSLLINSDCAKSDYYNHNYSGYPIETYLSNPDSVNGEDLIFSQSMAGVKTKILFPYIKNFGDVIINKAELVFSKVVDNTGLDTSIFKSPVQLVLLTASSTGANATIPDVQDFSLLDYGGTATSYINLSGEKVVEYKFSIATQLQQVISHLKEDYGLYLLTYPSPESATRVVLGGNNRTDGYQMKLNLIYTKLN